MISLKMIRLNFLQEKTMRKNSDIDLFKSEKKSPRILKVTQLIKKTLGEVFLQLDFADKNGENFIFFIDNIKMSKDAKIATVYLTSFITNKSIDNESIKQSINKNLVRIKRDFASRIQLRYTPRLKFRFDVTGKKSFELDQTIGDLKR